MTHEVEDRDGLEPWCTPCVSELKDDSPWPLPLAFLGVASVVLLGIGFEFFSTAASGLGIAPNDTESFRWITLVVTTLCMAGGAGFVYHQSRHLMAERAVRQPSEDNPSERAEKPRPASYRQSARPRRLKMIPRVPPASGKQAALGLTSGMVVIATLSFSIEKYHWLALGGCALLWWLLWTLAFTILLYRGQGIADDLKPVTPGTLGGGRPVWMIGMLPGYLAYTGPQSVPVALGLCVLCFILLFVGWAMAYILAAPLFWGCYHVTLNAMRHATRDAKEAKGNLLTAGLRGSLYGLLCTLPLATFGGLLVFVVLKMQ